MKDRAMRTSLALTLAILLGAGSMAGQDTTTDLPDAWMVTVGSQGGFAGGGSGYQIRANGRVRSWRRLTPRDDIETQRIGTASEESLRQLYAAMTSPELREIELSKTGNMTAFLDWAQENEVRRYTWPEGSTPPPPVQLAHDQTLAAVRDAASRK